MGSSGAEKEGSGTCLGLRMLLQLFLKRKFLKRKFLKRTGKSIKRFEFDAGVERAAVHRAPDSRRFFICAANAAFFAAKKPDQLSDRVANDRVF